jgi:hypothetical protein
VNARRLFPIAAVLLVTAAFLGASPRAEAFRPIANTDHNLAVGKLEFEHLYLSGYDVAWTGWRFLPGEGVHPSRFDGVTVVEQKVGECAPYYHRRGEPLPIDRARVVSFIPMPYAHGTFDPPRHWLHLGEKPYGTVINLCWYYYYQGGSEPLLTSSVVKFH